MRILGEWTYEKLRCTAMVMSGRYILKIESGLLEQTYKFRDGQFTSLDELKSKLTSEFYSQSYDAFSLMKQNSAAFITNDDEEIEFPDII